jgi:hypothetical protein
MTVNTACTTLFNRLTKELDLRRAASTLAQAGINIGRIYASALNSQDRFLVVLHTVDDDSTMLLLSE